MALESGRYPQTGRWRKKDVPRRRVTVSRGGRAPRPETEPEEDGDAQWRAWLALRRETDPKRAAAGRALLRFLVWGEPWIGQVVRSFLSPLDARLVSELLWLPCPPVRPARGSYEETILRVARLRILGGLPAAADPEPDRELDRDAEKPSSASVRRAEGGERGARDTACADV